MQRKIMKYSDPRPSLFYVDDKSREDVKAL